jgi:cupin fold WbuC family metalloprotein
MVNGQKGYSLIDPQLLAETSQKAERSPRKRMNHNFHDLPERVQRMLNAVEPDSYCRPHRHQAPPKTETFVLLRGDISIVIFNDTGGINDVIRLNTMTGNKGIDIKPGIWHTIVSNEPGTVVFEVKEGPYDPIIDKEFAPWAPEEASPSAVLYFKELYVRIKSF